ncbi:CDS14 family ICE transfer lipoprotein [Ureaplasma zalophigenitalium]|uniref:Lipoprotein n=1 Tax=Ureaplasma zalophigenitalium TaxID=907723 RepID=A0ABT3BNU5_9BACT|nr:hypothetical protein [Ureaplasma zalophigenitalium]MCV3753932.1 hypothetical protein [Ureaplasma zalophigenitalium]
MKKQQLFKKIAITGLICTTALIPLAITSCGFINKIAKENNGGVNPFNPGVNTENTADDNHLKPMQNWAKANYLEYNSTNEAFLKSNNKYFLKQLTWNEETFLSKLKPEDLVGENWKQFKPKKFKYTPVKDISDATQRITDNLGKGIVGDKEQAFLKGFNNLLKYGRWSSDETDEVKNEFTTDMNSPVQMNSIIKGMFNNQLNLNHEELKNILDQWCTYYGIIPRSYILPNSIEEFARLKQRTKLFEEKPKNIKDENYFSLVADGNWSYSKAMRNDLQILFQMGFPYDDDWNENIKPKKETLEYWENYTNQLGWNKAEVYHEFQQNYGDAWDVKYLVLKNYFFNFYFLPFSFGTTNKFNHINLYDVRDNVEVNATKDNGEPIDLQLATVLVGDEKYGFKVPQWDLMNPVLFGDMWLNLFLDSLEDLNFLGMQALIEWMDFKVRNDGNLRYKYINQYTDSDYIDFREYTPEMREKYLLDKLFERAIDVANWAKYPFSEYEAFGEKGDQLRSQTLAHMFPSFKVNDYEHNFAFFYQLIYDFLVPMYKLKGWDMPLRLTTFEHKMLDANKEEALIYDYAFWYVNTLLKKQNPDFVLLEKPKGYSQNYKPTETNEQRFLEIRNRWKI